MTHLGNKKHLLLFMLQYFTIVLLEKLCGLMQNVCKNTSRCKYQGIKASTLSHIDLLMFIL